jgi:AhpD family alkylhydroperoxidase
VATLTDKEKELVAIGASIGAGCQPCTKYHVAAALKSGLAADEVRRAIDEAQAVRCDGGVAVSNVGRSSLGVEGERVEQPRQPDEREQLLVFVGAAAGGNAAGLLKEYASGAARRFGLSGEELRSALEMAETVKQHAAEFFRQDVERGLKEAVATTVAAGGPSQGCCASGCE